VKLSLPEAAPWPPPELAELHDHPFDLDAHFAPIPEAQNAAPLYLEALAEFSPGMAICYPESERDEVRRRAVRRHERFISIFDSAQGRASPGMSTEIIDDVLEEYATGFKLLALAQERPTCAFELGHTMYVQVPHLEAARLIGAVVRVRNDRDLLEGRFDRPIRSLAMILRLAADLKPRGSLLCQLGALAIERMAMELALDILHRSDVRTEHIDRVIGVLLEHEKTALSCPLAEGHRIEYVYARVRLVRLERHEGRRSEERIDWGAEKLTFGEIVVQGAKLDWGSAPTTSVPLRNTAAEFNATLDGMTVDELRREARHLIDHYRDCIAVAQRPYRDQLANSPKPAGFFLTLPVTGLKISQIMPRAPAGLRMVQCLAAARRWHLETGQHPPDLGWAVQSAGMAEVPADPFGDGPIGMRLVGGQPVMFSIGPDGTNDGTQPGQDTLQFNPTPPTQAAAVTKPQQFVPIRAPEPPRPRLLKGSLRLFRLAGVDVEVHWSWALIAFFQIANRKTFFSSITWDAVAYIAVFAIVLLHELGHVFACRSVGGTANRVLLWPLGGFAFQLPPPRPGALFRTVAAGPLVNLLLAPLLFSIVWLVAKQSDAIPRDVYLLAVWLHIANLVMLIFNLLPVYPMDGGKLLLAVLWRLFGFVRALSISAVIGLVAGVAMLVVSVLVQDVWFGVTAGFLCFGAVAGLRWARTIAPMFNAAKRPGFACPVCRIAPPVGRFWKCLSCNATIDIFDPLQSCPKCTTFFIAIACTHCGHTRSGSEWEDAKPE
jgi:Zn-dependent protease